MSIAITLDKSTFQSLGHNELIQLHRYYTINVTPLLISEILGDLSKEEVGKNKIPKDVVVELANKIFPSNILVNANYKRLLENSLLGIESWYNNIPYLENVKTISTSEKQGLVFEETEIEKSIRRWKNRDFNSIDEIISWFWRTQTNSENVIEDFKNKLKIFSKIKQDKKTGDKLKNLSILKNILLDELMNVDNQKDYLKLIIDYFDIDQYLASKIFYRWESNGYNSLLNFSQYAFFCLSIISMYYVGLNNNLFSERKTNLLDLEYLYYTPCCSVFSSNDNFSIDLFNLIKPKDVSFISLLSLKEELKKFHQHQLSTGEISSIPPIKESFTYKLWDKVYDLKLSDFLKKHPRSQEELKKEFKEILNMSENGQHCEIKGEPDFISKSFYIRLNDPCICNSGKLFKDCCWVKK